MSIPAAAYRADLRHRAYGRRGHALLALAAIDWAYPSGADRNPSQVATGHLCVLLQIIGCTDFVCASRTTSARAFMGADLFHHGPRGIRCLPVLGNKSVRKVPSASLAKTRRIKRGNLVCPQSLD